MSKKLIYLFSFVFVLFLAGNTFSADDPSLVIYYDFEGFGNNPFVLDKSGKGNDATVVGDVSGLAGAGLRGSEACQITGNGSYLDLDGPNFPLEYIPTTAFTLAYWMKPEDTGDTQTVFSALADPHSWCHGGYVRNDQYHAHVGDADNKYIVNAYEGTIEYGVWHHMALTWELVPGEYGGGAMYIDGELVAEYGNKFVEAQPSVLAADNWGSVNHGGARLGQDVDDSWQYNGLLDDFFIFKRALSLAEIKELMQGIASPVAFGPTPADGSIHADTWANLNWYAGDFAVSHDVYFSDSFEDVNNGSETAFRGNQTETFLVVGFPGFAYPDGLIPGTIYYWRIDEVNNAEPNSPWKGDVWSFLVPPKTAYTPEPADGAESVDTNVYLGWTPGFGAKLHTVYFGDNFDDVNNATGGQTQGVTTYTPGQLKMARTYYWRVDEFDSVETHKGDVWSFITEGAVSSPSPANGAVDVTQTPVLRWVPGVFADTYEVYFGADAASLELKGSGNLGSESYEPGQLEWNTTYYWRIDEANNANADSPWTGPLWSFTTANFLIIDDFESYNDLNEDEPGSNRIWNTWIDGWEDTTNGSIVGYEYQSNHQTIAHSGCQSMPYEYDNSGPANYSEATADIANLGISQDWTIKGVEVLSLWFIGNPDNAPETMYVALSNDNGNTAVVYHDNPDATLINTWTQWNIDLQSFADQGVNLANVHSIALGLGNRANPVAGGSGMMYFDDIRLYPPAP